MPGPAAAARTNSFLLGARRTRTAKGGAPAARVRVLLASLSAGGLPSTMDCSGRHFACHAFMCRQQHCNCDKQLRQATTAPKGHMVHGRPCSMQGAPKVLGKKNTPAPHKVARLGSDSSSTDSPCVHTTRLHRDAQQVRLAASNSAHTMPVLALAASCSRQCQAAGRHAVLRVPAPAAPCPRRL
jgi:hypothetical protein